MEAFLGSRGIGQGASQQQPTPLVISQSALSQTPQQISAVSEIPVNAV